MAIREAISALKLDGSETVVLHVASRVFAALVASGRLTEKNGDELIEFSVRTAVELARQTDLAIESDGEVISRSPLGL
jgi:hypothetical protein